MYLTNNKFKPLLLLIDSIGHCLFFWKRFKKFPNKINKILIIRLDHIGDMILTTPIFSAFKKKYPHSEIHVLCRSLTKPIIDNNPYVDKIILFNSPWFARNDKSKKWYKQIKKLKKEKYDLVVELKADPRNILLTALIGGYNIGFGSRGLGFLLNKSVIWTKKIKHIVLRQIDILNAVNISCYHPKLELFPTASALKKADYLVNSIKNKVIIGINPGVGAQERQWPLPYFTELINQIIKNKKISIVLLDTDEKRILQIISKVKNKNRILNLGGKLDLNGLISIIQKIDLLIGLESASIHIASAVGTPCIDIHSGVTYAKEWGPYQGKFIILQNFVGKYATQKEKIRAMTSITPKDVLVELNKLI